jgi:hypothetical protein
MLSNTKSNYIISERGSKLRNRSFSPKLKNNDHGNSLVKL